jgi:hypothetical protein
MNSPRKKSWRNPPPANKNSFVRHCTKYDSGDAKEEEGDVWSMWEDLRVRNHLEVPGADGRIILKWTSRSEMGRRGLDCIGSVYGHVTGACECGNEYSGSTVCGEFVG